MTNPKLVSTGPIEQTAKLLSFVLFPIIYNYFVMPLDL
ncbi:MAG: hypothetical protein K0S74_91 [Chlamydiales bacterium]|jgi:hypothetical protein|nr:hypothetical protein [Chlamydiales bacterium]